MAAPKPDSFPQKELPGYKRIQFLQSGNCARTLLPLLSVQAQQSPFAAHGYSAADVHCLRCSTQTELRGSSRTSPRKRTSP